MRRPSRQSRREGLVPLPAGRKRVAALVAAAALLAQPASAGELAVLHGVLASPSTATAECKGPANVQCMPGAALPTRPAPAARRIGVETTDCYRGCPAFTAIFSADGTFTYFGEANIEHLGEHTGSVERTALWQVMRLADEVGFASLEDTYATAFLDNPTSYVMVEWATETKVVRADGGAEPVSFWALRQLLIGLLEDATWD